MTSAGKARRMELIMPDGIAEILPEDHGVSWVYNGLSLREIGEVIKLPFLTAYIWHKGIVNEVAPRVQGKGILVHASAASNYSSISLAKELVCTPEEAVRLGEDGISVHVNTHAPEGEDNKQYKSLAETSERAERFDLVVLGMMYPRGPALDNVLRKRKTAEVKKNYKGPDYELTAEEEKTINDYLKKHGGGRAQYDVEFVKYAARLGAELGADIVKTNYTGSIETFKEVVDYCPVPVVIAGGEKAKDELSILQMLYEARDAGAAGYSFGRNIFQSDNPWRTTAAMRLVMRRGERPERALEMAKENLLDIIKSEAQKQLDEITREYQEWTLQHTGKFIGK